jgi:thioredoxin 2
MTESMYIVCPHCDAVNRIPAARIGENPKCGKSTICSRIPTP